MKGIYFEEKGIELLGKLGVTKAEFARRMGIQRQNVNALFKTNNLEIIARASKVLDVPMALLVSYVDEPDIYDLPDVYVDESVVDGEADEIRPEDVPVGDSVADRRARQEIIKQFYFYWKKRNPDLSRYNTFLKENIYINHTSFDCSGLNVPPISLSNVPGISE